MTTIQDLPEEILSLIFENFDFEEILQCQEVCRAWYFPAHISRLAEVVLLDVAEIDRFIAAIDHNPHPSYLGAVKEIAISTLFENHDDYELDIYKMFFRFRNLKSVKLRGQIYLTKSFNDQVCKDLLQSCPQLENFEMNSYDFQERQFNGLYNVRLLLTLISIDDELVKNFKTAAEIISTFPRLKRIFSGCDYTFQELLPVFEYANCITTVSLDVPEGKEDFAERYLTSKTIEQQHEIKKSLAKIEHLTLYGYFCVKTILFVSKYLTGLQSFRFLNQRRGGGFQEDIFCSDVLDLVCHTNQNSYVTSSLKLDSLSRCFPAIMRKVFDGVPFKKSFSLSINDRKNREENLVSIDVGSYNLQRQQTINITASNGVSVNDIATSLFTECDTPFNAEFFSLDCSETKNSTNVMDINTLDKMLRRMPLLKEIRLELPLYFVENESKEDNVYPMVEKVTLRSAASIDLQFQQLLNRFTFMFPNIKRLNLYSFNGCESLVDLRNYSLEALAIDATPSKIKHLSKSEYNFFVIQVEDSSKRRIYKVDEASLSASRVKKADLEDFICGEDYYKIDVIVNNLQRLEVLLKGDEYNEEYLTDHQYSQCTRRIIIDNGSQ